MRRAAFGLVLLAACGGEETLSREALLDPETCQTCHPAHYEAWSGSMHAYAAEDPVFRAMNARGQRETGGELGDFCVQCHAPMAVREGYTTDGLNLDEVPQHLHGVTCYFCHTAEAVEGEHNNPIRLANDVVMRGGIEDPVDNDAHRSAYSTLHDRGHLDSGDMCGSCHDIVTPDGVHIERTFEEWKTSLFSSEDPAEQQTCNRCHMRGRQGVVADVEGVPLRRVHSHAMPGVDVAVTPWPQREAQLEMVQRELSGTVFGVLCVSRVAGGTRVTVDLENFAAGHAWPSGAALDRRAWVEVRATLAGQTVFERGALAAGERLVDLEAEEDLWRIGDRGFKENGDVAHMFWDIARYETALLPAPTTRDPTSPDYIETHIQRSWTFDGVADRVELNVHIRPLGLDFVDDLIDSGDLDPAIRAEIRTFTLEGANVVWTPDARDDNRDGCVPDTD